MTEVQLALLRKRLESYEMLSLDIAYEEEKIMHLYDALGGYHSPNLSGGSHSTNELQKEMNKHEIRDKITKSENRVNSMKLEISNLEYYITQLPNELENMARKHYAKGISYKILANVIGYDESWLRRKIEKELIGLEYDKWKRVKTN